MDKATNPERFAPLHSVALDLLNGLAMNFDLTREERLSLDQELEARFKIARPSIRLTPRDPASAPLVVVFSAFPGLHVRFGRWCLGAFPACGCDACEETIEGESESLTSRIENLTAGRFRETITSANGIPYSTWEFWSAGGRETGGGPLDYQRAAQQPSSTLLWKAWARS